MSKITRSASVATLLLVVALCVPPSSAGSRTNARPLAATTTPVASFISGGGAGFMRAEVDARGHLSFESPRGVSLTSPEGYALCTGAPEATAIDIDASYGHSIRGFTAPVISQPRPGVFPVTITRRTTDGHLKLTARWTMPDPTEKDVTVTMTLKNIGTTKASNLELIRSKEIGGSSGYWPPDWAAATADSAIEWAGDPARGLVMTARTLGVPHEGGVVSDEDIPDVCGAYYDPTPNQYDGGGFLRIDYFLGSLAPGASVSVAFTYQRI